jgi:hypothetical protein
MKITFPCKFCKTYYLTVPLSQDISNLVCPKCLKEIPMQVSESLFTGIVDSCALCGRDKFYIRKAFNRKLGVVVVFIGIILSSYYSSSLLGLLILMGITLLDAIIYYFSPWMTVCYTCQAEYRGFKKNPRHKAFDLKMQEQYRRY